MTTRAQFITQAKNENPAPLQRIENGVTVTLSDDEYETTIAAWADMKIEQQAAAAAADAKAAALASARTKLAALGLTDAEVAALLGS